MTVAFLTRKRRRAAVALGAVSAGLLVLSACDKPSPVATVTVGSSSVNSEAACYDEDGLADKEITACLNKKAGQSISADISDKIRFGVDPEVAEKGWTIFLNGTNAEPEPFKKTYRTIPASAFFASQMGESTDKTQVAIVETNADNKKVVGIWSFELKKQD
ncbi:DUF2771 domain-containing protein [Streptomyces roseicoloratus]|uniref:DUF2771 domain-containing protein n=1 Tax=Streptomyces roseicoloratus TaxID=2508722 RepID=A0ABY9RUT3_9ACTN|nr:DUF2771 domain-containing protein [Streptomyces roseicoloratus]WMX45740.1 DUF2771 domain-containing protein [Streptomyces roseicoloratus]